MLSVICVLMFATLAVETGGEFLIKSYFDIQEDAEISIDEEEAPSNIIAVIDITGPIIATNPFGPDDLSYTPPGVTIGRAVAKGINTAAENKNIKGILLRVSSPGGLIEPAVDISSAIKQYRDKTGNPVVAHISTLSASAAVYATATASKIVSAPGSLIGSIGVLGPQLVYYDQPISLNNGLLGGGITTKNGISVHVIHAGKGKELGNPFRRPTDEEIAHLQNGVNEYYQDFVEHMALHRNMDENTIRDEMGAKIYTNKAALRYKLIDNVGGFDDALEMIREMGGLDDYELKYQKPDDINPWMLLDLLGANATKRDILSSQDQGQICSIISQAPVSMMYPNHPWHGCLQKL